MFTHQNARAESDFIEVETVSGNILTASLGHYVWAVPQIFQGGDTASNKTQVMDLTYLKVWSLSPKGTASNFRSAVLFLNARKREADPVAVACPFKVGKP